MDSLRKICLAFVISCLPLLAATTHASLYTLGKSQPDWITHQSWENAPPTRKQSVQYLLVDDQIKVEGSSATYFYRGVDKALTQDGIDYLSKITIAVNPEYQKLDIHKILVIRDGQKTDRLHTSQIREIQREEEADVSLYDGIVDVTIFLNDIRKGDIVEFSYSLKGRNPVLGEKFFNYESLGWTVTADKQYIRLLMPEDRTLNFKAHNSDLKPFVKQLSGGITEYTFLQEQTTVVRDDGEYPPGQSPFPWLSASEYDSWADVIDWALPLYQMKPSQDKGLLSLISQLDAENKTNKSYVEAALRFVQEEVRYLGLEFGENSHRPSQPEEILARRYGDCKDKAVLMNTLLQARGIPSWGALVSLSERGSIANDQPSPGAFDHVINLVELDGELYWLDGTRTYQGTDLDHLAVSNFEKALVLREGENQLTDVNPRHKQAVTVLEEFTARDYSSPVQLTMTTTYEGSRAEAQRSWLDGQNLDEVSQNYLDYFARFYPTIELRDSLQVKDDRENNVLISIEHYSIPDYWEIEEDLRIASFFTTGLYGYMEKPERIKRNGSYWPGYSIVLNHDVNFTFPNDVQLNLDGWSNEITTPYFNYTTGATYRDRKLAISTDMTTAGKPVPVSDIPVFNKNMGEIIKESDYTLRFYDPMQGAYGKRERLLNKLEATLASHFSGKSSE